MPLDPGAERDLIEAAVGGDEAALQGLLLLHFRTIEAAIQSRFSPELAEHLEVEDLVQEVFVDVHKGIGLYREYAGSSFVAWLQRLVDNRIVDTVRYYRRLKRGGGRCRVEALGSPAHESLDAVFEWVCADKESPYRQLRSKEAREMAHICVASLNENQRRAVIAYYFDHLSPNEIAEEMQCSPAAVRELLRRARHRLAALFGSASAWLSSR